MGENIDPIYYKNLPRKYMAAASLLMNKNKELLLVKPVYKNNWDLPGGVVSDNESPQAACKREILEELGLDIKTDRLLVMDFLTRDGVKGDTLQFIFLGGLLNDAMISRIQLQKSEISEFTFAPLESAAKMVSNKIAKRLIKAFDALDNYTTLVLENGEYA